MKHKQFLAIPALALAIGFGSLAVVGTHAEDPSTAEACSADALNALQTELGAGTREIRLTGKVCPTSTITLNRDVVLDLNGHDIVFNPASSRAIDIRGGNVTIKGKGSIIASDINSDAVRVFGARDNSDPAQKTNVVIESGVELVAGQNSYGLFVSYDTTNPTYGAYNVTVTLKSGSSISAGNGLYINGSIKHADGPVFNVEDGVEITAGKGSDTGVGIYAAGYGTWNIGKAVIKGGTGIGVKSGVFNLTGTEIVATAPYIDNELNSNGINENGATFQIEKNDAYAGGIDITVDGGEYTSYNNGVFVAYGKDAPASRAIGDEYKVKIKGGTFTSADQKEVFIGDFAKTNTIITGGTFTSDVKSLLADNLTQDASGQIISGSATVTPTDPDQDEDEDQEQTEDQAPDTGVNTAKDTSAVGGIGSIGVGAALVVMFALWLVIRRARGRRAATKVNKAPKASRKASRQPKGQTAVSPHSQPRTAPAARQKAQKGNSRASAKKTGGK